MRKLTFSGILFLLFTMAAQGQMSSVFQAEHEKNEGVLLVWDYTPSRDSIVANIAGAVQNSAKAWIIYYPGTAPYDTTQIRQYLLDHGVGYHNVHFLPAWTETLWIRDFGPFTGYGDFGNDGMERYMLDAGYSAYGRPKDDSIPSQIANYWGMPSIELPLELEGGNILLDGLKYGFASTRLLDQNPDYDEEELTDILEDYFNHQEFILLEELTQTGGGIWGHVDMYIKVVDSETLMVSKYPETVPDFELIESQVEYLSQINTYFEEPFEILRIPAPPNADGTWPDEQDDEMRTYTNSLTMNDVVVVPSYGLPYYDSVAEAVYREAMPGYTIEMVDSQNLTPLYGAVHCITKEIPQEEMLRIIHRKMVDMQPYDEEMLIYSQCYNETEVDSLFLYYRKNGETEYTKTEMYQVCPQNYGVIPDCDPTDTISYYIEAKTATASTKHPLSAPNGNHTFWFDPSTDIADPDKEAFSVYPNPARESFFVLSPDQKYFRIELRTLDGRLVMAQDIRGNRLVERNPQVLPGIYILSRISGDGERNSVKLILQ